MAIEKRHIVLATLIVALGSAVYINWQFGNSFTSSNVSPTVTGQSQYVSTTSSNTSSLSDVSSLSSQITTDELSNSAKEYFANAKTNRQEARDKAIDELTSVAESTTFSSTDKKEVTTTLSQIAKNITDESAVENLIMAKNLGECMVYIDDGKVSVVIANDGLMEYETVAINEIVSKQLGVAFKDITIVEVK